MAASDHLGIQFKATTGKRQGVRHTMLSAHLDDQKVGYAKLTDRETTIDRVHVDPGHRGSGVGHALMNEVTSRYGHNSLHLEASPFREGRADKGGLDKPSLESFYGSHGFEPAGGGMMRRPATGN